MNLEFSMDKLLEKMSNKFLLSIAAARRARQIKEGAVPLVPGVDPEICIIAALKEIELDKIGLFVPDVEKGMVLSAKKSFIPKQKREEYEEPLKEDIKIRRVKEKSKKKKSRSLSA